MNFSKKIGISFLALILLTVVTGCIGLLFVYRVLTILGTVSDSDGPLIENLEDLNRYIKKTVAISREVSAVMEIDDILQLRSDFNQIANEFDRTFQQLRRGIEDDMDLGELEQFGIEHQELKANTQALISAIIEELQTGKELRDRLSAGQQHWKAIVERLALLHAAGGGTRADPTYYPGAHEHLAAPVRQEQFLSSLARLQHSLMVVHLKLNEYFTLDDPDVQMRTAELDGLFGDVSGILTALTVPWPAYELDGVLEELREGYSAWRDVFLHDPGALALYRRGIEQKKRTDALSGEIQSEARDTVRILDSLVRIRTRLVTRGGDRGFVTAAPTLLVLSIAAATALSVLLGIVLTRNITRPVRQLIAATEAVRKGDYSRRLQTVSGDELARLSDSFNRMIDEINRSQEEVRSLNAGLEQRVRDRTAELEEEVRERRRIEGSLRESEDRYRTLIENFPNGVIFLLDRSRRIITMGGEAARLAEGHSLKIVGRKIDAICPPELAEQTTPRLLAALRGEKQELEIHAVERDWHVTIVPNSTARQDEGPETFTVLALDITEAKKAAAEMKQKQQQLIQADKLASLGVLVAGVAHEINNPNQAIMMGGQLLYKAWPDIRSVLDIYYNQAGDFLLGGVNYSEIRETMVEHVKGIVDSAQRIETIIQGLKDFARHDQAEMSQVVNLNVVVKSALILVSNLLRKTTDRLSVDCAPQVPAFFGNIQRVEQVVINLVQNACQALPDRNRGIFISTYFDSAEHAVVLEVRDEGSGIAEEDLTRILDPFFTTRRQTGGTGLGLSVSATIVKEHGGALKFYSGRGEGTTARAFFPARNTARGREA